MRRLPLILLLISVVWWPALLAGAQHSGSVRAADQLLPGATVTARKGDLKEVGFTDENGRYTLMLAPGVWDIQVEMFGFPSVHSAITIGNEPDFKDWTLDMPRYGEKPATPTASEAPTKPEEKAEAEAKPAAPATQPASVSKAPDQTPAQPAAQAAAKPASEAAKPGASTDSATRGRRGRSGPEGRPGFQNAQVRATQEGEQALADAAGQASAGMPGMNIGDAEDALLLNGSTSGGLAAASDDEAKRQHHMHDDHGYPPGGGPPGEGGGMGLPPGMGGPTGDSLGLGGLGASAVSAGLTDGLGGGPSLYGGPGGPGGPGGERDRFGGGPPGGSRGGYSGGGPSGRSGRSSRDSRYGSRGPYSGQYSSFGNRMRTQSAYMGSVYGYLNNSALNAAPFSLNGQEAKKPSYANGRFGASFGGPLIIPKLVKWQRASFYFSYSGTRSRNPYSTLSSVPTPAERAGDFSQAKANTAVTVFDPASGQPFPLNQIPVNRFDPAAAGLLKYFPQPTYPGLIQNYQLVAGTPSTSDNLSVRLNAPLSKKDRLTFNEQFQTRDSRSLQLFGFEDSGTGSGMSASVGWSHSFAPRFNNSASISLSRNNNKNAPYFAYGENVAAQLGITGTAQDPIDYGPPNLSFTNFGGLSDGTASVSRNQTISFTDSVTYVVKKKHNMTFGFSFRRMQQNSLMAQNARGTFSFSGLLTSQLDARGQPVAGTGFDFADFLLGLPQSSTLRYGSDNNYFRGWSTSVYAQDDFRLTRRLSVNFGLRYEYFAPYTELYGHLANLDVNSTDTAVAVVTPGTTAPYSGSLPPSLIRSDPNNLSPRFGFGWRPTHSHSLVLRGGYSIFFSGASYSQMATQMSSQPPFAKTTSISTSPLYPLTLENGFPINPAQTITNTYAIDPDYRLAYAQSWSFAVQNTLPHGLFVEVEYIGTKGTDLGVVYQPNRAAPGSPLTAQNRLPIANASGFTYQTDGANSSFNAAQVRTTRRFSRGMSAIALYTFSKALDDASSYTTGGSTVQFPDNLRLERGLSSFDQRHKLSLTYLLSSPVGVHGFMRNGGWKTATLTGWMLSGSFSASSGTPLTARVAGNLSNTGGTAAFGTGRAEATGLPIDAVSGGNPYFNLLAFTTPLAGQYGDAGKSTIPGLFNMSVNASLNRAFRLGDNTRRQIQLRLSASNALNHVVITNIGTTINSATYGLPTGASGTRTVTLMLRFSF